MGSIVAHIHVVCSDPSKLEQTDITANAEGEEEEDDEDDDIDEDSILADQEKADEAKKQRKLEKKKLKQKKNSQDANGDNDDDDDEGNKDSDDEGDEKPEIPEINVKNMGQLSRVRDSIMNVLIERTHDKSYFTRAAILKTWASLLEANSVPVSHFSTICDIALDRLVDKTAMVRKNAIGLLTAILDNNPFGGMLDIDHHAKSRASLEGALINRVQFLRASNQVTTDTHELLTRAGKGRGGKGKKVAAKLGVILEEYEEEDDEDGDDNESVEDEDAKRLREQIELEEYNQFLQSEDVKGDADVIDLRAKLEYTEDTLRLIESMTRALQSIEDMLFSKSSTDVTESLQFVARAVNFSIKGSAQCLQK